MLEIPERGWVQQSFRGVLELEDLDIGQQASRLVRLISESISAVDVRCSTSVVVIRSTLCEVVQIAFLRFH